MNRVREWKPGDVALTKSGGTVARTAQHRWVLLDDGHGIDIEDERIARPLVVIDPEDREQVERLTNALLSKVNDSILPFGLDLAQAALREFVGSTPPKPEEPTGLGAVVEDAAGERWIRLHGHDACNDWYPVRESQYNPADISYDGRKHFYQIDAVKVISDGIPA